MPLLNQSELQVLLTNVWLDDKQNVEACDLTKEEKWVVTCGLTKDTGEFGFFGQTLIMVWPLKLSLRHSDCASWNKHYKTPLWLFKIITPIAAWLYYWASVLKCSDFLPAKCFCRRLHATFLVSVYYDCGRKSDVWMNLSGRQTQLCMTLFLTCLLSEMLAKQLHR